MNQIISLFLRGDIYFVQKKVMSVPIFKFWSIRFLAIFCLMLLSSNNLLKDSKSTNGVELKETILEKKVDFLISIAENVMSKNALEGKVYSIAFFGKSEESKELYNFVKDKPYKVGSKKVEFSWFKRLSSIKEVDLLYVHSNSNTSLSEIKNRSSVNCVFVTEDFPYGKSQINFILNDRNELIYVMDEPELLKEGVTIGHAVLTSKSRVTNNKDWKERLQMAQAKIKSQQSEIQQQANTIDEGLEKIVKSDSTILGQQQLISAKRREILQNEQIISQQRTFITIVSIGALVILMLLFFVYRLNQKRKIALDESERKTREIVASITYAQRIQQASLPSNELLESSLKDGFIMYNPKDIVSGDFYWLEENRDEIYFAVADCTGHGVPGALLSVLCCNFLSRALNELKLTDPSKILDSTLVLLDEFFAKSGDHVNDGMDIILCKLNKKNNVFEYAGANRPLYYFQNDVFFEQKGDRQPIGKYEFRKPYENHTMNLSKGDVVYLFSDGIVDQFGGPNGKKYSSKRLREFLQSIYQEDMNDQKILIQKELNTWKGNTDSIDDACMLGVRIT